MYGHQGFDVILYQSSRIQRRLILLQCLRQSGSEILIHFFSKLRLDEDYLQIGHSKIILLEPLKYPSKYIYIRKHLLWCHTDLQFIFQYGAKLWIRQLPMLKCVSVNGTLRSLFRKCGKSNCKVYIYNLYTYVCKFMCMNRFFPLTFFYMLMGFIRISSV